MKTMKFKITLFILFAFTISASCQIDISNATNQEIEVLIKNITWIDNACIKVIGSKKIYFDPYNIKQKDIADIIFITHDHYDHFSINDIDMIANENTIIVGPECVMQSIDYNKKTVQVGDVIEVKGVQIQVVPSYNLNIDNHARNKGYVGYIVTMDKISYYHPGDSDFIPEMKQIKADVAFLPVCGDYMMSSNEAVMAALEIDPKVVIPIHYGSVLGSKADALEFEKLYTGKTAILKTE